MDSIIVWIFVISLILGYIKYASLVDARKGWNNYLNFIEFWNGSLNFLMAGLVAYYFIMVRFPLLSNNEGLKTSDFVLFLLFVLGAFGHLSVMSYNITNGVETIIERFLKVK